MLPHAQVCQTASTECAKGILLDKAEGLTWMTRIFLKPFLLSSLAMTLLVLPFLSSNKIWVLLLTFFSDAICNAVTCK